MADTLGQQEAALKRITSLNDQLTDLYKDHNNLLKDQVSKALQLEERAKEIRTIENKNLFLKKAQYQELEDIAKQAQKNLGLAEKRVDFEKKVNEAQEEYSNQLGAIRDKIVGFAAKAKALILNPWLLAGLALLAIVKIFKDVEMAGENFRQSTGITGDNFERIRDVSADASVKFAKFGIDQAKSYELTKAIVDEFGSMDHLTDNIVDSVAVMSIALGMSSDESAKVVSNFMAMLGGSSELANNMLKTTAYLAEQGRVAPGAVIRDISDNAENIAKFTQGSGDNIARAAVMAQQLGINMGTVTSIAEGLLQFESSIEAEMNAMVLTGKSLNLERARALALEGDLAGLQKEIVKNLATEVEWNNMNMIQRKAMADALGIGVAEMGKMISRQKTMQDLTRGTIGPMKAFMEGATLSEVLDAENILSPLTELGNSLIRIVSIVVKVLNPAFKALNTFLSVFTGGFGKIDWWEWAKNIGLTAVAVLGLAVAVRVLRAAIRPLAGGMGKLFGIGGGAAAKGGGMFSGIFGKLSFASVLKGVAVMALMAGALFILGKALQEFTAVKWEDMAKAGAALVTLGAAMFVLGAIFTGPQLLLILGAIGVIAALSATIWILGSALQQFTKVDWEDMAKAGVALIALSLAMLALGAVFAGPQLLLILAAIGVIAAFAVTLWILGKALQAIKAGLDGFASKIVAIGEVGNELMVAASAIFMLSGALAALGIALAQGSVLDFFGLGGGGMIDKLIELADNAENLQIAASAVQTIATGGAGGGIAPAAAAVTGAGTNVVITPTGEKVTLADVVEKLDDIMDQFEEGVDLKLNGAVVGQWLAKTQRKS